MTMDESGPSVADPAETVEIASATVPQAKAKAEPVEAMARVASVDVIRGFALLGILAMNMVGFAWPGDVYGIPILEPESGPASTALWAMNHLIFDTKMMTLFSMLFGAGLVLMSDRAEARGAKVRGVYYRRVAWLLVIGLVHSYLIWDGDVLVLYALCGFVLYPFRKLRPRTLIITGVCFNLLFLALLPAFRYGVMPYMKATADRVDVETKAGKQPGWWDGKVHDGWVAMNKEERPNREEFLGSIASHRASYPEMVKTRAKSLVWGQTIGFPLVGWWLVGGRMLIGMGLMKLGVFAASLSRQSYLGLMAFGYGLGLPLLAFDTFQLINNGFFLGHRLRYMLGGWPLISLYASLIVVFGHIGLVMLICKSDALPWLTRRLAAVGRMALSNYLFDSIACTTFFYGYGFDYFGTLSRPLLYLIVLAVWTAQLLVSPLWLGTFRFGPAEWIWRSLTYWKPQSMRTRSALGS